MTDMGIKDAVRGEICALARKYDVDTVIVFGSRARGDFRRASDIDLAVQGGDVLRFTLDVKEETSTLLDFDVIDLSRTIQTELRDAIRKEGVTLYEKF